MSKLTLCGVRENNLKNLDVHIKHDALTVITGVSGSGKSTLAFDTIYAEGGRRYIETFSPYTRQFLDRLHKPDLDSISGVRPAIALEQHKRTLNSRSTVGTVTEINDFLKVIWSRLGVIFCPKCRRLVQKQTPADVLATLEQLAKESGPSLAVILFPLHLSGKASAKSLSETLLAQGFLRCFVPESGEIKKTEDLTDADLPNRKRGTSPNRDLFAVTDRVSITSKTITKQDRKRLLGSIAQAYTYGHGHMAVWLLDSESKSFQHQGFLAFSEELHCAHCDISFSKPKPSMFSFNSPLGACTTCHGFGKILTVDPELCIPNPSLSISQGAIACWNTKATSRQFSRLKRFCEEQGIDTSTPWHHLSNSERGIVFAGHKNYKGVVGWFKRLERKSYKMHVRVFMSRYRNQFECPECHGTRLQPQALFYEINKHTIADIWNMPAKDCFRFFDALLFQHRRSNQLEMPLEEIRNRLSYLVDIGLGYLTLERQTRTLSGGESQRVNLTSLLGSRLVHTSLVLDEPTIGLHSHDTNRLLRTLKDLATRGNTVIAVEHDQDVIRSADDIIDLGPKAGKYGGQVVARGSLKDICSNPFSLTGHYLTKQQDTLDPPYVPKLKPNVSKKNSIAIIKASANNLKNIDVHIPLGGLSVLSGVSGSGKSSLAHTCLFDTYSKLKNGSRMGDLSRSDRTPVNDILGLDNIDDIVLIDQSPLGKTPRSNPATYTKAWDIIRQCLSETADAERLGLSKSAFSFNLEGGRCPECKGAGFHRVEMQFLADVFVECEACGGSRFQDKIRTVRFLGKSVTDFLDMTLSETAELFCNNELNQNTKKASELLQPLLDLGLGYLKLGHPLNKLSGGEAQRVKLASYLNTSGKEKCLFILDEPSTGLHPHNVSQLLSVFAKLIELGHSILCIEHNFDIIATADWLIDLGPEGGDEGGEVVVAGNPKQLLKDSASVKKSHTLSLLARYYEQEPRVSLTPQKEKSKISKANDSRAIQVIGARHHNLKDISLNIPKNTIIAVTGVSGSGKSSLAFDIVFSEGQRRYIDCLSPYARQFIRGIERPDVDLVDSIPPTVAVSQKIAPPLGISTIATTTEIYQYLRLLYAKTGIQHCPDHDVAIRGFSAQSISDEIMRQFANKRVFLFAPAISGRKGYYNELFNRALRAEIDEAKVDGKILKLYPELRLERHKLHWISLLIASISKPEMSRELLEKGVEQCLLLGGGTVEVAVESKEQTPAVFSTQRVCPKCRRGFHELDPQDFSFRSRRGVCTKCNGRGHIGEDDSQSMRSPCPECEGSRISALGRHVYVQGKRIHELTQMTSPELICFLESLDRSSPLAPVVSPIIYELRHRLQIISSVGLDYLQLGRESSSISGGEAQRLRLARTLGQPLTGICYVLDEPTIGLHPSDHLQLMKTLRSLRDAGNTVIVVEHDEETIRQADHVIDIGPWGGAQGGEVVAAGTVDQIIAAPQSLTGRALKERMEAQSFTSETRRKKDPGRKTYLELIGARTNNLRNVKARFPIGELTVVAGVSGAGKSSLIHSTLVPALLEHFEESEKTKNNRSWDTLQNDQEITRFFEIDQMPLGRTSTSTPASFLGIFNDIRKIYAMVPEAKMRGWDARHFSFNTGKGRCDTCQGKGYLQVPMSFLPMATTQCEVCNGLRYNESALEVLYQGISIGDLLQKTMDEAREIFANHKRIRRTLDCIHELGLGYLTLGQPSHTLSGGEAQRLKIARELSSRESQNTLYIFDEPTIGLHMIDVEKLLSVIRNLIDKGNTAIIIEHNIDVIRAADYLIELGPGSGDKGGKIVFSGPPEKLAKQKGETPTKRFVFPAP